MFLGGTYLRGQSDVRWKLRPSIGRPREYGGKRLAKFDADKERLLFHRFRRTSYSYFRRTLSEWEALFLARHHGLPVRLLDWTSNPLVGLYWACEDQSKVTTDGALWLLRRGPGASDFLDVLDPVNSSPLKVKGIRTVVPLHVSPRITAQSGVMTIHDRPQIALEDLSRASLSASLCDIKALHRWVVPAKSKASIVEELEKVGVNARTLLPDLDGLCLGLWRTEVVRSGKA
jgi:hypothetical protein